MFLCFVHLFAKSRKLNIGKNRLQMIKQNPTSFSFFANSVWESCPTPQANLQGTWKIAEERKISLPASLMINYAGKIILQ